MKETESANDLSAADREAARRAVQDGAQIYFDGVRARIPDFVDRHFTVAGTLRLHRAAFGWDILRAPLNLSLALPQVLMQTGAKLTTRRLPRLARLLRTPLQRQTDVSRDLEWLIFTELLALPCHQKNRESRRDALGEAILAQPAVTQRVEATVQAIGQHGDDPAFRARLDDAMVEYGITRAAAAEIATGLLSLTGGALTLHKLTPGAASLGPVLAGLIAQQAAIGAFPLGSGLGSVWYGIFPAAPAAGLVAAATGGLMLAATLFAAFAGIVADPLQRATGLHARRLRRLVDALERQWATPDKAGFSVHDHYVARLLDVFDLLATLARLAAH